MLVETCRRTGESSFDAAGCRAMMKQIECFGHATIDSLERLIIIQHLPASVALESGVFLPTAIASKLEKYLAGRGSPDLS